MRASAAAVAASDRRRVICRANQSLDAVRYMEGSGFISASAKGLRLERRERKEKRRQRKEDLLPLLLLLAQTDTHINAYIHTHMYAR